VLENLADVGRIIQANASRGRGEMRGADLAPQLICPSGIFLSIPLAKNISLSPSGKSALPARAIPPRQEGRFAIVTNAGREAVDAAASSRVSVAGRADEARERSTGVPTNGAVAYGKTVWSWHPLLVSSWRRFSWPNRVLMNR
jgi:hypothetical protein